MTRRYATALVVAGLAAIVAAAFWQRWRVLGATPFPVGIDGYFYPVQVRSLLEHGTLRYPASPVTFYWMLPFAAATDPITGAKIAAALGTSLIAVPAYGVGARLGGHRGTGFVAAVIAAFSASDGYLAIEFVKQGIGLAVAVAALWATLRALEWEPDPIRAPADQSGKMIDPSARSGGAHVFAWRRVTVAVFAVVAAFATHKLAAVFVLVIAVPAVIVRVRNALRGRRLIYAMLLGVAAVVAIVIAGVVAPQRFVSTHDLAMVKQLVTSHARLEAPALVRWDDLLVFDHEALLAGLMSIAAIVLLIIDGRRARPRLARELRIVGYVIAALGIAIAFPYLRVDDPQGLGFRLRISAFVPLALCAAICAGELAHRFASYAAPILVGLTLVISGVELPQKPSEGEVLTHPALAAAVSAAYGRIPGGMTVIVPERHILFMVDWYTRADVSLRPEKVPRRYRIRMFNLPFIGDKGSALDRALDAARNDPNVEPPLGLHPDDPNGLVLVSEPTWSWLLGHLPDDDRRHFAAWPTL